MMYFILGSHPELSIAELKAVLGSDYRPVYISESVAVIEPIEVDLNQLQERLAGIVKVGRISGQLTQWDKAEAADQIVNLTDGVMGKNKISFGLSVYDVGDKKTTRLLERELDSLGLEVKKRLKEAGRPVRYVKGKEPRLSSAIVETNGLLTSGGEYVLFVCENNILIGRTEAIQNFKAWGARDFGRPARDAKNGMLPPKLARMMINLGGINPQGASLLDPFCGSGTVLMEAALMGFGSITGSDISQKAMADTAENMEWLDQQFDIPPLTLSLHHTSAEAIPSIQTEPVDLIVTEVFLGNPRTRAVDSSEVQRLESELLPLFHDSFESLMALLKPTSRAVVAFPAYKETRRHPSGSVGQENGTWYRLPLKPLLTNLGYRILDTHLYFRESQLVARDIYVLTRK